jgi:ProP effector
MTEKTPKKPIRDAVLDALTTEFPVFRDAKPLAIGIHKAILERRPELTKEAVSKALRIHTGATRYLKALSQADHRYDLDGNEAGDVTGEQREAATNLVKERIKKATEKRKAEEAQRKAEEQSKQRQEKLQKLAEKFSSR